MSRQGVAAGASRRPVLPGVLRALLLRIGLFAFGCAVALLLGECALRAFGYVGDRERTRSIFDARYGAVPRDSWIWDFRIDPRIVRAVDLRGTLIALPKPAGQTRILFLGDSATEGAFVAPDQNYPAVFARLLRRRHDSGDVQVINAGVWGMTTIDEYHLLRDKLLPLEPDVVVLGLFMANDLNMNLAHRERIRRSDTLLSQLRTHSALAHFLYLRLLALSARAGSPKSEYVPVALRLVDGYGLHMLSYPAGELATYMTPPSSLMQHAFGVLRQVLADFQALGRRHHFSVRVLLIPSPSRVLGRLAILHYPHLLTQLARAGVKIDPAVIDVDAPTRRVVAICDDLDLPCVDPTRRLARLGPRAFFPHDEHPSATAHRMLAEALLQP